MLYVGIDPGLDGALCAWEGAGSPLSVLDMPTYQIGKKRVLDALGLARWADATLGCGKPVKVFLEFVASSPQMGVASAFKFGQSYGVLQGILAAQFVEVISVTPAHWKRAMKVTGDKDECRAKAASLFPTQSALFARKKDDGRAEAVLLAVYGSRQ